MVNIQVRIIGYRLIISYGPFYQKAAVMVFVGWGWRCGVGVVCDGLVAVGVFYCCRWRDIARRGKQQPFGTIVKSLIQQHRYSSVAS